MEMIKFIAPLNTVLPRKTKKDKTIYFNMNVYRNLDRFTENTCKDNYCMEMFNQLQHHRFDEKISIHYILYRKDARKGDKMNPLSIHDKYFCDALIYAGCIEDDSDKFIGSQHFYEQGIDRKNPRVEIIVTRDVPLMLN